MPPKPRPQEQSGKKTPRPLLIGLGLALVFLIGGGVAFTVLKGKNLFGPRSWDGEAFYRELAEFDALLVKPEVFEKPETLNRVLDKLERKALGVESYLSTLKRRRLLARQDPRFIPAYQKAAQSAAEALPSAEALAAVAAESLLLGSPVIDAQTETALRVYASRLFEADLKPLAFSVYMLLGDLDDPVTAGAIPNKETLFSAVLPETAGIPKKFDIPLNLLLLQILHGDTAGAGARINTMLQDSALTAQNPALVQLGAEFFYDFDTPLRAAELFAQFSDERSLARQADALWLSGYVSGARNIWNLLLAPEQKGEKPTSSAIAARSLYNLAATTERIEERRNNLRHFMETVTQKDDKYYIYGLIYYSRLLDAPQSIQVLESAQFDYADFLLDLELLRRYSDIWSLDKAVSETWLLLNRYAEDPRIYQWACYFFDLQRRYDETAELIRQAGYRQISGPWMDFHDALRLMRTGQTDSAEKQLKGAFSAHSSWQIPANIARILETKHDPAGALSYYEIAAPLAKDKKASAKILFRMSRCFYALRREQESGYALEQALQFDPDYLNARLELQRRNAELP
ncbi:MAG: hypothetical protein LBG87_07420 [Spirochaetaceae bacterium]|jgi:hypothetical protein|nr:hypothetical protein [Spirochaetaceae bacterium]